ncbi:MAG: mechanosensitive ion channel family protein [Lewinellaceae bacterium]|nr:mechanosensitive ion channel family protein [Lewinellaceae bacterium]
MEFFQTYKDKILYIIVVLLTIIALRILTNFIYKRLAVRAEKKFPGEGSGTLHLVKRILNALWLVLGIITVYYLSTPEDSYTYTALTKDFQLFVYAGLVAVATIVGASTVNIWFRHTIQKKKLSNSDTTNLRFLRYVVVVGIYIAGFLVAILAFPSLRGIAQTALGGAGIVAVVVAIASQEALANIVSGVFIISFKPFKVGDIIELEGTMVGAVTDITLRHTVIRNFDNKMIVIPNSIINKEKLVNANMGELKCCERLEIGIAYKSDIDLAKRIMREECENHRLILDNRTHQEREQGLPVVKTAVTRLNDFSVTIRAWAWVRNYDDVYQLRWDVYESVKKRFDREGIEIPFPYRTVVVRQEEDFKIKMDNTSQITNKE